MQTMEQLKPIDHPEELLKVSNRQAAGLTRQNPSLNLQSESLDGDQPDLEDDVFLDYYASFIGIGENDKLAWQTQTFENSLDV
jgi:hypothetical protein